MRIKSAEFVGAIGQIGQEPPEAVQGLPKVAFAGRSNVGKSSLINRILGRTRTALARVSQEPGKTQEINFYTVRSDRGEFCLVDLPGYGYAKVSRELRERWRPLINGYLARPDGPAGVVQLVDLRRGPTDDDLRALDYLAELQLPALIVLTKADKLKTLEKAKMIRKTLDELGLDLDQVIPFSSRTGDGREDLLDALALFLWPEQDGDEPDEAEPA